MAVELRVFVQDRAEAGDLREWMSGLPGVVVRAVAVPADPLSQGVWDFLSVACEAGGPVVAAVRALQLWIEARITVVEVAVGDRRITVRTADASTVLPEVTKAAAALESAGESRDEPS